MMAKGKVLAFMLILLILAGCATSKVQENPPDLNFMSFVQDGTTSKKDVLLHLGQATGEYAEETILTYRIFYDPYDGNKWRVIDKCLPFDWEFVTYNLVFVFDEKNVLKSHSLIPIRNK